MTADNSKSILLLLEIPRTNDKKELAAEQMFAALHGILKPRREVRMGSFLSQDHISFEIAAIGQRIRFYVWVPKQLQYFVEGQVYAQYPTAQISEAEDDYANRAMAQQVIYSTELTLTDNETIPVKTFVSFEVDPLAAITATLAKLEQANEEMWVQVIARPIADDWHKRSAKIVRRIKRGQGTWSTAGAWLGLIGQAAGALIKPPSSTGSSTTTTYEPSERDKTRITAIEEKSRKLGYQVKVRIIYAGNDAATARLRMQAMVGTFKQFNTTNLNGFQSKFASFDAAKLADYQARSFLDKGFILNIEELASLYHLPHTSVETPNIVWATTKTSEPPATLPVYGKHPEDAISLFGNTNFRGTNLMFGLLRADRGRHAYIIGQTGTGKSGLLELLTLSDIYYDQGFAVIDPHGDLAANVLRYIPARRVKDVIYFNPADTEHPIGFNPLEKSDSASKGQISSELVGVLKRMFDSWGPRLEYILRFTLLALLDYPNATMLDINRMLTEKRFRDDVIHYIDDPIVKNFWVTEFASWNEKFASEAVAPVLNKVGAFTANPIIRNIVGQPKSTFNIRKTMDEGKIFIVNLSRGLIGEDNAAILGSMIVTKIQLAAMSRADIPRLEDRRPFYLYVDEFQNFATESFAVILSEARKYALNLTVANQYISQMEEHVRGAVFGNVGTMVVFRVSPDDSPFLVKYFEPQFEANDLSNLHNRHFVSSMSISGEKAVPFSGTTLNIPKPQTDTSAEIITFSREHYTTDRPSVEAMIKVATLQTMPAASAPSNSSNYNRQNNSGPFNNQTHNNNNLQPVRKLPIVPLQLETSSSHNANNSSQPLTESQKRRNRRKRKLQATQQDTGAKRETPQTPVANNIPVAPPASMAPVAAPVVATPKTTDDETVLRLR